MFEASDYLPGLHPAAGVYSQVFKPAGNLRADRSFAIGDDISGRCKNLEAGASRFNNRAGDFDFGHRCRAPHPVANQQRPGYQDERRPQ